MSQNFPRTLALLRKEKGLSQKQVSKDLGISQSLLSHYEKGIRECGHDFLIKAAKYYDVSIDYLLGLSADRRGAIVTAEDIPDPNSMGRGDISSRSMLITLNKKLIANTINIIFGYLAEIGENELTSEVADYIMICLYDIIRLLHSANKDNQDVMFQIPIEISQYYTNAISEITNSNISSLLSSKRVHGRNHIKERDKFIMDRESIKEDYAPFASSLFSLIKQVEQKVADNINCDKNNN